MKLNLKYFIALITILIMIVAIVYKLHGKRNQPLPKQENKVVVSTFTIIDKNWQSAIRSIGNVKASQSIIMSSEVPGIITNINFESGQAVTQGQVILNLRADTIVADLEKAQASLQDDLKNYGRRKALLPSHYISVADVDHFKALVEKDQSEVKRQKALLAQHAITAPFSGVLGILQVQMGQYITPGQSLVNLESIDPVFVDFSIAEKWISRINIGAVVDVKSDAYPGDLFTGHIVATSNAIDVNNRSLLVRVAVPNRQKKLLSGMAVNVSVNEPSRNKVVVPQSALAYTPDGIGIYTIDKQNVAHWHTVVVGERKGDEATLSSGLAVGDTVVIAGQQKIHDGLSVVVNNQNLLMG